MRYIANYPTITDGPKSRNSYVSATGGVSGAGHGLRIQLSAGSSSWNDWMYF